MSIFRSRATAEAGRPVANLRNALSPVVRTRDKQMALFYKRANALGSPFTPMFSHRLFPSELLNQLEQHALNTPFLYLGSELSDCLALGSVTNLSQDKIFAKLANSLCVSSDP